MRPTGCRSPLLRRAPDMLSDLHLTMLNFLMLAGLADAAIEALAEMQPEPRPSAEIVDLAERRKRRETVINFPSGGNAA